MCLRAQTSTIARHKSWRQTLARREETFRRLVLLTVLYAFLPVIALHEIFDPDIWWHLRVGQWIIEHGTIPVVDRFSSYGMGQPWVAYSWLFEVLVYSLYQAFGLLGLVLCTASGALLIAIALYALVWRFVPSFPVAVALTGLGLCGLPSLLNPRPWLFTILFFILELDMLLTARRSGQTGRLWLLPPLFALWANIHIQFTYGLLVLALAMTEPVINWLFHGAALESDAKRLPLRCLLLVTIACASATLITPYHLQLYRTVFELMGHIGPQGQSGSFQYITELMALGFRTPWDWFVLAAALGGVFMLGRQRELRPFPLLLLTVGALLSFHSRRDAWFVVIAAVASMATACTAPRCADSFTLTRLRTLLLAGGVVAVLGVVGWSRNLTEQGLTSKLAATYPVAAAAVVAERGYAGPLYNHYNWGGYLIWRLPHLPVAMDGRSNLHGAERLERSQATWAGRRDWATDPELLGAGVVISGVDWPLAALLRLDARFELVYEDEVAVVFVARTQPALGTTDRKD